MVCVNLDFHFGPTATQINIIRDDGGNFLNDGFLISDGLSFVFYSAFTGIIAYTGGVISFLNDVEMTIDFGGSAPVGGSIEVVELTVTTELKGLIYSFGLVENNGNFDIKNLVTNEDQVWYSTAEVGTGSPRSTSFVDMDSAGIPKSWKSGTARVRYISGTGKQIYEIEHIFVVPFFRVQDIEDFFTYNLPPEYLLGNTSLKYVFHADFRTTLSNPNTSKNVTVTNQLGSVGWFDETFNGFNSNYQINAVTYTDASLASADGVLINGTTYVTVEIEKIVGNFGTDRVGVYFGYLPELPDEIENTLTNFEDNFVYDNIFTTIAGATVLGTNVLSFITATAVTNILTITFRTTFTTAQQLKFSNEKKYILGFEVGDSTLSSAASDCVILKTTSNFDDSSDIPDLMTFDVEMYPHTEDFSTAGVTDFRGWNEHGIAFKGSFILDLTKDAFINSFEVLLVAYKTADGSYFPLDSYNVIMDNTLAVIGSNTYQTLNVNTTRNYPLIAGSEKNGVTILLDNSTVGTTSPKYDFEFAQKISWEDWRKNFDANPIFTDYAEPNNNLNFKSSNYSYLLGYKIRILYKFNVAGTSYLGVSGNTDYLFFSPDIKIHDYDVDGNTPPNFSQTIETFTSDGLTDLGGVIQSGVDTLFKITWTLVTGPITNLTDYWGVHRIEETGQIGKQIFELSSYETNELTLNYLKPITGSYLTTALVAGNLVTTCLIDGSKIQSGVSYNISGEIASPPRPKGNGTFTNILIEETGMAIFSENDIPLIIE